MRPVMTVPMDRFETMQDLAKDLLVHAPPRFAMAGLSMGGILAMEVLRQAPDRVAGLALMDTNPKAETDTVKARRTPQIAAAMSGDLRRVMRDEMKPNYLADGPNTGAILDLCMAMAMDLGPEVFIRQSKALRDRPDQQETLRGFTGPALVLCGAEDTLCPLERHELMHALMPQSHLEILPNAGHLPTLEQPALTTQALMTWLETL